MRFGDEFPFGWVIRGVDGASAALAALALLEPVAIAIHLEDVDMVGQPVEQRAVSRSEANTLVHSSNGRLLVTMVEPRS